MPQVCQISSKSVAGTRGVLKRHEEARINCLVTTVLNINYVLNWTPSARKVSRQ